MLAVSRGTFAHWKLVLHGTGHFVVDASNQDPNKSGTLMLATLNPGNLETWKPGTPGTPGTLAV